MLRYQVRIGVNEAGEDRRTLEYTRTAEHCRIAYLRGRFLAHGSLSLASGRTHLEFVLPPDEAGQLSEWLRQLEMPATWRLRRGASAQGH